MANLFTEIVAAIEAQRAEGVGIPASRLAELRQGMDPTIDEVRSVAKLARLPIRRLLASQDKSKNELHLRQNFGRPALDDREELDILDRANTLAPVMPPREDFRVGVEMPTGTRDLRQAEQLASFCRELFRKNSTEPLIDLEKWCTLYTSVAIVVTDLRSIEGCALSVHGRQFIFLAKRGDARMRFTLAHELCHYFIDLQDEGGWFDENPYLARGQHQQAERFANAFAAALLLPAQATATALQVFRKRNNIAGDQLSDGEVIFLARYFGVNFQVAAHRCEDLQLIPQGGGEALYDAVVKRYHSPERLGDQLGLPARPHYNWNFARRTLIDQIAPSVREGSISMGRLSEALGLPIEELSVQLAASLAGKPLGFAH